MTAEENKNKWVVTKQIIKTIDNACQKPACKLDSFQINELESEWFDYIEEFVNNENAAIQKQNADLISTITRNEETIAYYKELSDRQDLLLNIDPNRDWYGGHELKKEIELLKSNKPT